MVKVDSICIDSVLYPRKSDSGIGISSEAASPIAVGHFSHDNEYRV